MKWAVVFFHKPLFQNVWGERFQFLKRFFIQPIIFVISSQEIPFLRDINALKWKIYRTTTSSCYTCYILINKNDFYKISEINGSVIKLKNTSHYIGINVEKGEAYTVSYFENCYDILNRFEKGVTLLKRDEINSYGFLFDLEQTEKRCILLGAPADNIPRWTVSQFQYRYKSDIIPVCQNRQCQIQTNL